MLMARNFLHIFFIIPIIFDNDNVFLFQIPLTLLLNATIKQWNFPLKTLPNVWRSWTVTKIYRIQFLEIQKIPQTLKNPVIVILLFHSPLALVYHLSAASLLSVQLGRKVRYKNYFYRFKCKLMGPFHILTVQPIPSHTLCKSNVCLLQWKWCRCIGKYFHFPSRKRI